MSDAWTCVDGYQWRSHRLTVPLDWQDSGGSTIEIYAREVRGHANGDKPYLLYLQGGPGFEAPRLSSVSGWMKAALERFNLVLLDQRGTGFSTPVDASMVEEQSDADIAA